MKRIGIITMHRLMNHGSFLQAYALKRTIEANISNVECEFVDLPSGKKPICNKKVGGGFGVLDILRYFYHKIKKDEIVCNEYCLRWNHDRFDCIYRKCLKKYLKVEDSRNYNTAYEAVIIGSDEVFNCTQEDAAWGTSMVLFGEGVDSQKIISYAASFGYTTEERIHQFGLYEKVSNNLLNFKDISVRDSNSSKIVLSMAGIKAKEHLDPVLIYDFQKELRERKRPRYFVIYQYQNRITEVETIAEIKKIAKEKHCKIVSIFEYCNWADKNVVCTPFGALEYIRDAEYVVTDTFHGCVMSIKFNKKFATFCRKSNLNKLKDLLNRFQLESQLITGAGDLENILNHEIEWEKINKIIEQEKERSIAYLRNNLSELGNEVGI